VAPVLGLALAVSATACSGGPDPAAEPSAGASSSSTPPSSPQSPSSTPTDPDAPVTLRFSVYGNPAEVASYERLARAYEQRKPQVTIKVHALTDRSEAEQRLATQFSRGTAPDVFLSDSDQLPALVRDKRVQPVDELLEDRGLEFGDRYERLGLEGFAAQSALQCMPSDVSPYVVFYNKRLLDLSTTVQPGETVPAPQVNGWSWQQFTLAAQAVSRGGVQGVYLPPSLTTLTPLLRSAGADVVDDTQDPRTLTLGDDASLAALQQILVLARDHRVNPTPSQLLRSDALSRFEDGRLAMLIGTRDLVPRLRAAKDLPFDAYPLPSLGRFRTIADVAGYCISSSSPHIGAAADFVRFASGDRGASITARSGGVVPANLDVRGSAAFVQPGRFPNNATVFTSVIRRADTMPNAPAWPTVASRSQPLIGQLFYGSDPDVPGISDRIDAMSKELLDPATPSPSPSTTSTSSTSSTTSASSPSGG
jgi:multiple sugar transport system substrate-binding protein